MNSVPVEFSFSQSKSTSQLDIRTKPKCVIISVGIYGSSEEKCGFLDLMSRYIFNSINMRSFIITETSTSFRCRLYRIVAAPVFLRSFASDRRHMKRSDGTWIALPPQYDCLVGEGM